MEIVKNNLMLKSIKKKISMNFLFQNIILLLILTFFCLSPAGRTPALAQSFSFIDTGQRLGKIIKAASIACGDMNNDGYVDLVLASQERGTIIQLYLNDGKGNFTRTDDIFPVTENPNPLWNFGIVLRDFNRDGLLDIATADAWRGVNVYLNTNDRGFQWSQAILVPEVNEVKGIDAADIDHDGDDDLVFGGHNGIPDRADRIYLNDGTGNFIDSGQRIGFDVTWDTIFGDIDNDGNIDYISINRYREHTAKIHLINGKGIFNWTFDIPTTQTDDSYDVKLADLNMDGLLDIVIANSWDAQKGTTSKVFINKGNLNFELTDGLIGEPNRETKGIEVIDIDNDGYPDIILGNYNWANTIYRNDGTGKFTKMDVQILANPAKAIAACDVNNDGFIDLIIGYGSDTSEGYYKVFLNDGKGLTKNLPPDPPTMLKSEVKGKNVYLSWKPGFDHSGAPLQFTESRESIGCLNGARIIAADVNGDGKLDIIVGNGEELRQQSEIYLNDGKGHFTFSGQTFDKYFLRDMVVGDIDGDGDVDCIVGTQGDGVKVLKNDGNGLFQIWQNIGSEYVYVRAVDLGDVDGDGDLDLLYGSVGNRIYLNDGKGNFVDSGQDLGDHYLTQVVKFADLNRDGHLDFVQGNRIFENYDPADRVFFNNGNGVFIDSGQRLGQWSTMDIDIGDVDGDGALDLVAVCPLNGVNKLYLNDGNGFFIDSGQSLNPSSESNESHAVRFGDLDHDGDLDIVIGDWNLGLKIFLNDGHGHFTKSDISLGTGKTGHIVLVDIDQDGDLDIIESKKGGDCNKIYLNNQAKTPQIGLTYNIRVGTYPGRNNIVSGVSSYGSGHLGNALSYVINGLREGTYYWSVQTVNSSFKTSEWSQEKQFVISKVPDISFSDVSSDYWAYDYIVAIYNDGITTGCAQDDPNTPENERRYCPEDSVTRGQMAAFIIRAKYGENFSYTQIPYFSDVPATHVFFKYVQKLKGDGITAASGIYGVDSEVTRGQMAAFIIRAKFGENFSYTTTPYFSDVPSTQPFFKYVQKLKDEGITAVTGTYAVDNIVTRAQMAAFLARAFLGME